MSNGAMENMPQAVLRWEINGGTWRVQRIAVADVDTDAARDAAVVELRRCDGGEVADVIRLTAPADLRWARAQLHQSRSSKENE